MPSTTCVYRAHLQQLSPTECWPLLSGDEKKRASLISDRWARHEFITTRALVRVLLSEQTGEPAGALQIATGPYGKPVLTDTHGVYFNVSHSCGVALVAIAATEIGIDIERIDDCIDHWDIAASMFSPDEIELLSKACGARRTEAFFSIWTRKEAYLKAMGRGFSADLQAISAACPAGTIEDESAYCGGGREWFAFDLSAPEGFKAALVTTSSTCKLDIVDIADPAWLQTRVHGDGRGAALH